jgi:predicted kinase
MSTLYVMVGVPGSGKSTYARKIQNENRGQMIVYISRDIIRLGILKENDPYFSREDEVYDAFCDAIAECLKNYDVIADATHMSHGARAKLINALAYRGMTEDKYDLVFVYMDVPLDECIRRDSLREGRAHVTEPVIRRMHRSLSCPKMDEFANVKEVRIVHE